MHKLLDLGSIPAPPNKSPYSFANQIYTSDMIRDYWQNLLGKLDLSKGNYDYISIATPFCYDCLTRSTIIDILTHQYGIALCNIIPRALCLMTGYLLLNPQDDLQGNLLIIGGDNKQLDYAFIFVNESQTTLEYQGWGSLKDLQYAAAQLGLYSNRKWGFDHIIYENNSSNVAQYLSSLQSYPAIKLISPHDVPVMVEEGLRYLGSKSGLTRPRDLRILYPYDFYLQKFDPLKNQPVLTKIPFDTANLELNLNGSYQLARLTNQELYPDPKTQKVSLSVYEFYRHAPRPETFNRSAAMVFEGLPQELPVYPELWLNMMPARITLVSPADNTGFNTTQTAEFLAGLKNSPYYLSRLLKNNPNQELIDDIQQSISSPAQPDGLDKCLDTIRLKLSTLLQLWSKE